MNGHDTDEAQEEHNYHKRTQENEDNTGLKQINPFPKTNENDDRNKDVPKKYFHSQKYQHKSPFIKGYVADHVQGFGYISENVGTQETNEDRDEAQNHLKDAHQQENPESDDQSEENDDGFNTDNNEKYFSHGAHYFEREHNDESGKHSDHDEGSDHEDQHENLHQDEQENEYNNGQHEDDDQEHDLHEDDAKSVEEEEAEEEEGDEEYSVFGANRERVGGVHFGERRHDIKNNKEEDTQSDTEPSENRKSHVSHVIPLASIASNPISTPSSAQIGGTADSQGDQSFEKTFRPYVYQPNRSFFYHYLHTIPRPVEKVDLIDRYPAFAESSNNQNIAGQSVHQSNPRVTIQAPAIIQPPHHLRTIRKYSASIPQPIKKLTEIHDPQVPSYQNSANSQIFPVYLQEKVR